MSSLDFEAFFSENSIIRVLCRHRAARAKQRHDRQFVARMIGKEIDEDDDQIDRMFPSRRFWKRAPRRRRSGKAGFEANRQTLVRTVFSLREDPQHREASWLLELREFVNTIRERALSTLGHSFSPPEVFFQKKRNLVYRPIAKYILQDRVLDSLTARYLRSCFDPDLDDAAFAFRTPMSGLPKTHHDAVRALCKFHLENPSNCKWVAECDIKGFFDCVGHAVAASSLAEAVSRVQSRGAEVDPRALRLFAAFLDSYTFTFNVLSCYTKGSLRGQEEGSHCKWPVASLGEFWTDPRCERIGLPQGAALSCLASNLVLHRADKAVDAGSHGLCYVRYCDDMVILHRSRDICAEAFERYQKILRELKLPLHPPKSILKYGREFWNHKSKEPYRWTAEKTRGGVPWLAFVGYHIHYSGRIRIRPSSIDKEIRKQVRQIEHVVRSLDRACRAGGRICVTSRQVVHRVRLRLISMSVGHRSFRSDLSVLEGFCWASGFELLREFPFEKAQLKNLDRSREKVIRLLVALLKKRNTLEKNCKKKTPEALRHYGFPFSYAGQFVFRQPKTD